MSLNKGLVYHAPLDKVHSKVDNMMEFDGTDDYITFDADITLGDETGKYTTAIWMNITNKEDDAFYPLITGTHAAGYYLYSWIGYHNNVIKWYDGAVYYTTSNTLSDNTWHHIVFTFDGSGGDGSAVYRIYIDGVITNVNVTNGNANSDRGGRVKYFGKSSIGWGYPEGLFTQMTVWDSELSATEVAELHNLGFEGNANTHSKVDNLQGYWINTGNRASDWLDKSANHYDGAISGSGVSAVNGIPAVPLDITPNRNNGINHGAVIRNHGASFNGSSDYIDCGSAPEHQNVTMTAWVKPSTVSSYQGVCGTAGNDGFDGYRMGISSGAKIDGGIGDTNSYNITLGATNIVVNTWNHIAMVADGTSVRVYLNGVDDQSSPTARSDTTTFDDNFVIGAWADGNSKYTGSIANVALWSRALSATEVLDSYNGKHITGAILDMPLDGDYNDKSGNDNNGTNNGSTMIGTAADFDGTDDYISVADSDDFSFGDTSNDSVFSGTAWVNPVDATNFQIVFKDTEWQFYLNASKKLALFFEDESSGAYEYAVDSGSAIPENVWTHVAFTYNGVGGASANAGMKLYVNGIESSYTLGDSGTYVAMENSDNAVTIGKQSSNYSEGKIKDVRLYNRVLSVDELGQLYRQNALANAGAIDTLHKGLVADFPLTSGNAKLDGYTTFDGVDDYINVGSPPIDEEPFSIFCWVSIDGVTAGNKFMFGNSGNFSQAFGLYSTGSAYHLRFEFGGSGTDVNSTSADVGSNIYVPHNNTWQFVGVTLQTDGTLQFYLNGIAVGNTASYPQTYTASSNYYIGDDRGAAFFKGNIADLRVYTKALSAAQVADLYAFKNLTDGLVGRYPLSPSLGDETFSSLVNTTGSYPVESITAIKNGYRVVAGASTRDVVTNLLWATDESSNRYRISYNIKLNAGVVPTLYWNPDQVGGSGVGTSTTTVEGANVFELSPASADDHMVLSSSSPADFEVTNFSVKKITGDYTDRSGSNNGTNSGSIQSFDPVVILDKSVNQNHGIVNGATVGSSFTTFDGSNDYIDVGDSDNLITGNNVTITVWVKNTGSTKAYIVQNQKGAGSTNMTLSVNTNVSGDSTAGEIAGLVWNGSAHGYIAYDGNIDDSAWHHLALTTTSSAQVLYLDGVSVATTSHTFANAASTDNTIIGNDGGNAFEHTGSIANVKIYNRALSRKEINQLMRETNPQ